MYKGISFTCVYVVFFQAEDGIRDYKVTGVQTCALPISLLEKMGANIFHAGAVGAGQTAKICNNMLLGILMIGTSEAIALGVANGLDPKVLSEIMRRSSGGNWALEKYNPFPGVHENAPASKNYAGGFGTEDRKSTRLNSSHLVISYAV